MNFDVLADAVRNRTVVKLILSSGVQQRLTGNNLVAAEILNEVGVFRVLGVDVYQFQS